MIHDVIWLLIVMLVMMIFLQLLMMMVMVMMMMMMMVGWQRCASRRLLFCSILQLKCSSLKFFMLAFIIIFILIIILIIYHSLDKVPVKVEYMVIWYYICDLHHFHFFPSFTHIKKGYTALKTSGKKNRNAQSTSRFTIVRSWRSYLISVQGESILNFLATCPY